mgnify:CR=1 FL=1
MKITKKHYLTAVRKAERELDIEFGVNIKSYHRIHKNKKTYDKKQFKKNNHKSLEINLTYFKFFIFTRFS